MRPFHFCPFFFLLRLGPHRSHLPQDYTTICPPAPSEVLAIMALRNREIIVATNMRIIQTNMRLLTGFFEQYADMVTW